MTGLPVVKMIWAQNRDGAIGRDNCIPWRLKEDMQFFQRMTEGSTVIMGRQTWVSLPKSSRPLPRRRNIVLTRDPHMFNHAGAECFPSLEVALASVPDDETVWVIGGSGVYLSGLPFASEVFITEVDVEVGGADTFMPPLPPEFILVEEGGWLVADNGIKYRFNRFVRS